MTTFLVEIDTCKECGSEFLPYNTLQEAWEEFVNQVDAEQRDGYECSRDMDGNDINDGLMLRIWAKDFLGNKTCIFQYDNRYGTNNMSLMYDDEEAIIDKEELMVLDF